MQLSSNYNFVHDLKKGYVYAQGHNKDSFVLNSDAFELLKNFETYKGSHVDFFTEAIACGLIDNSLSQPLIRLVTNEFHLKRVQWELTLSCNLSCAHCYCSASPAGARGVDTTAALRIIDDLAKSGVLYLDFTGGEPLIRKDIFDLITYAQGKGIKVSLFTNATLVTEEIAKKLSYLKIDSIQTSLDGITSEVHDTVRRKKGAFNSALTGIEILKKQNLKVTATVVITKANIHQMPGLQNFFENEVGIPFRLDRMIPSGRALESGSLAISNSEFHQAYRNSFGSDKDYLGKVCEQSFSPSHNNFIEPGCGVGINYLFIKHNGKVVLCPTMTESENPDFVAGDISKNSIYDIWNNHPTFTKYRRMQCRQIEVCPTAKSCRGGCRSNAYLLHGSVDSPDELECNRFKNPSQQYFSFTKGYEHGNY